MASWNKRHRLLLRWSIATAIIAGVSLAFSIINRTPGEEEVLPGEQVDGLTSVLSRTQLAQPSPIRFENVTDRVGLDFRHFPATRASLLPEDMGSGVAVGDFDDDGLPDLFLVNFAGNAFPGAPLDPDAGRSRLYRNVDGQRFEDVTASSGIDYVGLGMAAAWGDYDSDGDLDLYITAFGPNRLYENNGDGTFRDVTDQAGVQDTRFSAGASWADYDRDGHLDLYVCNYVDFIYRDTDRNAVKEQYSTEQPYTLNPSAYRPLPNALFRNRGDGTFENVAAAVGVDDPDGRSLSVSWVDYDSDGWVDLYVANDVSNNGVFRNLGRQADSARDGTFEDIGPQSLAGDYRGAMGIAVADFDNDLDPDLLVTHWLAQENALFRNMTLDALVGKSKDGRIWFMDQADQYGLGQNSLDMVGWATGFCDFDNDGRRDLWLVNGSTLETPADHSRLDAQTSFILWSRGKEGFSDVTRQASSDLSTPFVGRGGAQADFDGDGLVDLVVVVHGGSPMLLRNVSKPTGHWLRVSLRQTGRNTRALGARVYVTAGEQTQMAQIGSGGSYLSQDELTLHFGLGDADSVSELRIVWPDGKEESHAAITIDRELTFRRAAQ